MSHFAALAEALRPLLKERTEALMEEAARRLGKEPKDFEPADLERVLKRIVYPELARRMPAEEARAKVEELLTELEGGRPPELAELEEALRAFSLYIDWPEVQRLRRLVGGLRAEWDPAAAAEARAVVQKLKEKLEDRLVQQARALSKLEQDYERVKHVGGRKAKRLASLIEQIREAQNERILASAELERAQNLASELLKLVESSVVEVEVLIDEEAPKEAEAVPEEEEEAEFELDLTPLTPEQRDRIREIERGDERRRLEALAERYQSVLTDEPWERKLAELERRLSDGELLGEELDRFEAELAKAEAEKLAEARARYEWVAEKLREAEAAGVQAAGLWAQLAAVGDALRRGILPEGLAELEEEAEALLGRAEVESQVRAKARLLAEEAKKFAEDAKRRLDARQYPKLAEALDRLLAQAESGEVDEALFQNLKERLAAALPDPAEALAARLAAVPHFPELERSFAEAERALREGDLERAEGLVRAIEDQAKRIASERVQELLEKAERFGLELPELRSAVADLEAGRFPPLSRLTTQVEEWVAAERRRARARLARLRSEAERYLGLGGEALLKKLALAEAELPERLPDFEALDAELKALEEKRSALRRSLAERFARLSEGFSRYKGMTGETRSRLGAMMSFLEQGFARLERLGTEGLLELEQALSEAEELLKKLEEEYHAAKELASELADEDVEILLGVFAEEDEEEEAPPPRPAPPPAPPPGVSLERFRRRGVLAAALLGNEPEGEPPVAPELIRALRDDLAAAGDPRLATLYLKDHVLIVAFLPHGELVLLAEKPLLSRILHELKEALAAS